MSPLKIAKNVMFAVHLSRYERFALNAMNAVKKNLQEVKSFLSPLKQWNEIFHRYQQNEVKKLFSVLSAESGEKKFLKAVKKRKR